MFTEYKHSKSLACNLKQPQNWWHSAKLSLPSYQKSALPGPRNLSGIKKQRNISIVTNDHRM